MTDSDLDTFTVIDATPEAINAAEDATGAAYGRYVLTITEADIDALRAGKMLFSGSSGEYSFIVVLAVKEEAL